MSNPTTTPPAMPDTPGVKALKFVVIGLGVMIVLGVLTVIGRVVYLANQGPRQAAGASSSGARLAQSGKLALPAGAQVKQISLSGDRLAVHYEGPAGASIAVVDLASGIVLSRIDVVPELPR